MVTCIVHRDVHSGFKKQDLQYQVFVKKKFIKIILLTLSHLLLSKQPFSFCCFLLRGKWRFMDVTVDVMNAKVI